MHLVIAVILLASFPANSWGNELNRADTAWVLTSTGLVLFMSLPGIALFYGGLVRSKNVLSVVMSCFATCASTSIIWAAFGFSLALTDGGDWQPLIGGVSQIFLLNIEVDTLAATIPMSVFLMYHLMFSIFAATLIIGSLVERIKFFPLLLFSNLWVLLVYIPICHWVWGGGWLQQLGFMDFAGGAVVHASAGVTALIGAVIIGPRKGFPRSPFMPHNLMLTVTGAGILWVGATGFSAGSAFMANGIAGMAMLTTHLCASVSSLTWIFLDWLRFGKATVLGALTGLLVGLGAIASGAGFVSPLAGMLIGLISGCACYYAIHIIKHLLEIDDALDVFPIHGISGITGLAFTAIFADTAFGGSGLVSASGIIGQFAVQCTGILAVLIWSGFISYFIFAVIDRIFCMKISAEDEIIGLDVTQHDQQSYSL